jgi:hypothetical protein
MANLNITLKYQRLNGNFNDWNYLPVIISLGFLYKHQLIEKIMDFRNSQCYTILVVTYKGAEECWIDGD